LYHLQNNNEKKSDNEPDKYHSVEKFKSLLKEYTEDIQYKAIDKFYDQNSLVVGSEDKVIDE
jgi:hypothetical protein